MRIKPWVITGSGLICAVSAVGVIVLTSDPVGAPLTVRILFWVGLMMAFWLLLATGSLATRATLAQALWVSCIVTLGTIGALLFWRAGLQDIRLLIAVGFVTLSLSVAIGRLFRHG